MMNSNQQCSVTPTYIDTTASVLAKQILEALIANASGYIFSTIGLTGADMFSDGNAYCESSTTR